MLDEADKMLGMGFQPQVGVCATALLTFTIVVWMLMGLPRGSRDGKRCGCTHAVHPLECSAGRGFDLF